MDDSHERDPWTWLSSRVVYDNPWIAVEERQALNPAGKPAIYGIVRMKRLAVGILPITADGLVHLVGQWRPPLERYSWEMPEGGAEPGEGGEETARRELAEEAGLVAARLQPILWLDLSNSTTDEVGVVFLATGLTPCAKAPEDTEVLAHRVAPFAHVLEEVTTGRIRDSLTVAAVLRAHHMAMTGALDPELARAMLSGLEAGSMRSST